MRRVQDGKSKIEFIDFDDEYRGVPVSDAAAFAAEIVFLACADMVACTRNGKVTKWNNKSQFLTAYRKFVEGK